MTEQIQQALAWGRGEIESSSDSPVLDAELLLSHCIGKSRSYLYTWPEQPLSEPEWESYQSLILQRQMPTPIAYLLGEREFYSLEFKTTAAALIPRSDTELLVELALERCPHDSTLQILELGTGTGAIAITLKVNRPKVSIMATDISSQCLSLARENAIKHQVDISWKQSDWFSEVDNANTFDMIVSNPPYVSNSEMKEIEPELNFESSPTPALKSLDNAGRIVYVGSLSKSFFPGLRLGYLVASKEIIQEARALGRLMHRHTPTNNQRTMALFLALGHHDALRKKLRKIYKNRWLEMKTGLETIGLNFQKSSGGSSFWVNSSKDLNSKELQQEALKKGVVLEPGAIYYFDAIPPKNNFRLGYTAIEHSSIKNGLEQLRLALNGINKT